MAIRLWAKKLLNYEPFMINLPGKSSGRPYSSTHELNHLLTSSQDQRAGWSVSRSRTYCTGVGWYSIAVTSVAPEYMHSRCTGQLIVNFVVFHQSDIIGSKGGPVAHSPDFRLKPCFCTSFEFMDSKGTCFANAAQDKGPASNIGPPSGSVV